MTATAIGVFGSANLDLVVRVPQPPQPGETIFGSDFLTVPGGKGLNQAIAAARAGGEVRFLGTVGADSFGDEIAALLESEGVPLADLARGAQPTGTAHITVDDTGQNSIIVVSGANRETTAGQLTEPVLAELGWLVTQLELDQDQVAAGLALARQHGIRTVLTPAPARPLGAELLGLVDLLVPNQGEAAVLSGISDPHRAACRLSELCRDVVVTLGEAGALWASGGEIKAQLPARSVTAVDTTAAGDTFVGVLVTRLAESATMPQALADATVAAALAVGRSGATSSMPLRHEIEAAL